MNNRIKKIIPVIILLSVLLLILIFLAALRLNPIPRTETGKPEPENKTKPIAREEVTPPASPPINTIPAVTPIVTPEESPWPIHEGIRATVFWVGESASEENGYIPNESSAWDRDWLAHFGGIDTPYARNGFYPKDFVPRENPFYVALPYIDLDGADRKENSRQVYWYEETGSGEPLLKNRWVKVVYRGVACYGQWEDVGPFGTDDIGYVFGEDGPKYSAAGIDLSPAMRTCLHMPMADFVAWQFVPEKAVPPGPWREIVTVSGINW